MVLQTYALGKLFGKRLRIHSKRFIKHHPSFESTGIGITTLSTKQKLDDIKGFEPLLLHYRRVLRDYTKCHFSAIDGLAPSTSQLQIRTLLLELYCILKLKFKRTISDFCIRPRIPSPIGSSGTNIYLYIHFIPLSNNNCHFILYFNIRCLTSHNTTRLKFSVSCLNRHSAV